MGWSVYKAYINYWGFDNGMTVHFWTIYKSFLTLLMGIHLEIEDNSFKMIYVYTLYHGKSRFLLNH